MSGLLHAVPLVERLYVLNCELEGMSAKGNCELTKESHFPEQDLPWSRRPLAEEANLSPPLHTRQTRFRSEPQRHLSGMHHPDFTADLERLGMIAVRRHADLSCDAG